MFETLDLLNISFPHSFMSTVNDVSANSFIIPHLFREVNCSENGEDIHRQPFSGNGEG